MKIINVYEYYTKYIIMIQIKDQYKATTFFKLNEQLKSHECHQNYVKAYFINQHVKNVYVFLLLIKMY